MALARARERTDGIRGSSQKNVRHPRASGNVLAAARALVVVRFFIVALVLLASGCFGRPAPPTTGAPVDAAPRVTPMPPQEESGWTTVVSPSTLRGERGDVQSFSVVVSREDGGSATARLVPLSPSFVMIDDRGEISNRTTVLQGRVALDTSARVKLQIVWQNRTNESASFVNVDGPDLVVTEAGQNVTARSRADVVDVPPKLSVALNGSRVVATFASARVATDSCGERLSSSGSWLLRQEGNASLLVGFVTQTSSDACVPIPAERSRVVAETPVMPPGEVVVRVFVEHSCFCAPGVPWDQFEQRIEVVR